MHRSVCNNQEGTGNHRKADDVGPVRECIEPKGAQNRCTGYFYIQAIFVVDQSEEGHLVDNESLETIVEDG